MKKIISLMVALALFASTAFAAPISVAASFVEPVTAQTVSPSASADIDALFADVDAVPLTDSEAQAVEGESWVGAVVGYLIGGVVGLVSNGEHGNDKVNDAAWNTGAFIGATIGFLLF
jgi:hypothetical protein